MLHATIIQSPYDIIIGRPTIKAHNLQTLICDNDGTWQISSNHLNKRTLSSAPLGNIHLGSKFEATASHAPLTLTDDGQVELVASAYELQPNSDLAQRLFQRGRIVSKDEIMDHIDDNDYIDQSTVEDINNVLPAKEK